MHNLFYFKTANLSCIQLLMIFFNSKGKSFIKCVIFSVQKHFLNKGSLKLDSLNTCDTSPKVAGFDIYKCYFGQF